MKVGREDELGTGCPIHDGLRLWLRFSRLAAPMIREVPVQVNLTHITKKPSSLLVFEFTIESSSGRWRLSPRLRLLSAAFLRAWPRFVERLVLDEEKEGEFRAALLPEVPRSRLGSWRA